MFISLPCHVMTNEGLAIYLNTDSNAAVGMTQMCESPVYREKDKCPIRHHWLWLVTGRASGTSLVPFGSLLPLSVCLLSRTEVYIVSSTRWHSTHSAGQPSNIAWTQSRDKIYWPIWTVVAWHPPPPWTIATALAEWTGKWAVCPPFDLWVLSGHMPADDVSTTMTSQHWRHFVNAAHSTVHSKHLFCLSRVRFSPYFVIANSICLQIVNYNWLWLIIANCKPY